MDVRNNYKKTCRLCAQNISTKFDPLFENETVLSMKFMHGEKYIIKITKNDGLPQNVCSECLKQLSRIKNFLKKCTEAEKILLNKLKTIENSNALSKSFRKLNDKDNNVDKSLTGITYKANYCDTIKPTIQQTEITGFVEDFNHAESIIKREDDYDDVVDESISETYIDKLQKAEVENNYKKGKKGLKSKDNINCYIDNLTEEFNHAELIIKNEDDYDDFIEKLISDIDKQQKAEVENSYNKGQNALKSKDNINCNNENLSKRETRSNSRPTRKNDVKSKSVPVEENNRLEDKLQKTEVENSYKKVQNGLQRKDNINCNNENFTKRTTRSKSIPTRENVVKSKILPAEKDDRTTTNKDYSKFKRNIKTNLPQQKDDGTTPTEEHSKLKRNIKTGKNRKQFLYDLSNKGNTRSGIKPYKCEICEKEFLTKNGLQKHADTHLDIKKTYTCEICDTVYTTKSGCYAHLLRHKRGYLLNNNERPFKCPLCIKSFKLLSTLTTHCNTHSKPTDQKHRCAQCNANFRRSTKLKEHMNSVHYKIFPFKCELCPRSFVTGARRNEHVKGYHSGKRYKCDLCDKDFSLSETLRKHKKTAHYGKKRFVCEICNMGFVTVYHIEKHMVTHKIDETTKSLLISQTYEEITKGRV